MRAAAGHPQKIQMSEGIWILILVSFSLEIATACGLAMTAFLRVTPLSAGLSATAADEQY